MFLHISIALPTKRQIWATIYMASTKRTLRKSTVLAFLYCFEEEPRMFLILARAIHYRSFREEQWWRHEGRLYSHANVFAG